MYTLSTYIDAGQLGELPVEVHYTHHKRFRSRDRLEPDEPEGCTVLDVYAYIGGKEVKITDVVDDELREAMEERCLDWMQSEAEDYPEPEREAA